MALQTGYAGIDSRESLAVKQCLQPAKSLVGPKQRTMQPMYTTSSVVGLCYEGGVVLAADTGVSGGCLRFDNVPRIRKINENTMLAMSGDYADFQYLESVIEAKIIEDERHNDGFQMKPRSLYVYLSRLLYQRRNKFNPLWTSIIVAGMQDGKPFLGHVDMIGTAFESNLYSTGFGNYMGLGIMRAAIEKAGGKLTKEGAVTALQDVLRTLYYRDKTAWANYQVGVCNSDGAKIEGPFRIDSNWEIATYVDYP